MTTYDVMIVGAGAAGVFLGGLLRQHAPRLNVCLLEATHQPLAKVRMSGGGRCNVTHACFDPGLLTTHYPRGGKFIKPLLHQFGPTQMIDWLAAQGVALKTEPDGRMFPVTDDSATIVDALINALGSTPMHTGQRLTQLKPLIGGGWQLTSLGTRSDASTQTWQAKRVVIATGGSPALWKLLDSLGQPITPAVPSLFTFTLDASWLTALAGVSVPTVRLILPEHNAVSPQTGPLLITHWGISGPVTLRLSAFAARALATCQYRSTVQADWLPDTAWDDCRQTLLAYKAMHPTRQVGNYPVFLLPRQLWRALAEQAGCDQWAHVTKAQLHQLITHLKQCPLPMTGKGVFKEEFVQAGGVALNGIHPKTLESKTLPGLHFAGEVLDIDGVTGGFNFQNAWTTAYTIALNLKEN
jgi:predicted Rossmann fold flavoprotein